jgi:hypothetical protein
VFKQFGDGSLLFVIHLVPTADLQQRSPTALAERAVMIHSANIDARVSEPVALAHVASLVTERPVHSRLGC